MTETVAVAGAASLRFLLPARCRASGFCRLGFDPDATVGHLVQAAGVPLTEVGRLRLGNDRTTVAARTAPGSTIEVDDITRPEALPAGGFLLDVGLGKLARRLRLLGLNAAWSADAEDPELVARAMAENRVVLTQDRGLLMRRALGPVGSGRGALVRGSGPDDQLADVLDRFRPPLLPLTRCTACGGVLEPVAKSEVAEQLLPGTRRSYDDFSRCRACDRVYWQGAHARRIDALVRSITGS